MTTKSPKRWLNSAAVRARYGDVSDMWLWRRLHDDSGFPQPMVIRRRRHWDEEELDIWDALQRRAKAA